MKNQLIKIKNRQIWKTFVAYPAAAFVILQAVDFFIINYGLDAKWLTLSLIILSGGFLIALLWNWNHGEKGIQKFTNKERFLYVLIAVITLLFGTNYWVNSELKGEGVRPGDELVYNKLAILPFDNQSDDASLKYLSDGIPENFINRLSRSTNLKVLSRNSTFILEDTDRNSMGVKEKLGADLMLTGRIEQSDSTLSVNCQLVDVTEGIQVWCERIYYDREDILELEESIVSSLLKSLPDSSKKPVKLEKVTGSANAEAQAHFMKGRALSYGSTKEEAEKALDHFRQAIEIDPKFAAAYVAIANEKIIQAMFSTATREEIFNEARTAVQTALAFDPNSADAYYVDGAIKFYGNLNWDEAEESYKKSIAINPYNANAYIRYSAFLGAMKRHDESLIMAEKAIALDPISISSLHNLGWVNLIADNFAESEEAFTEALDLHPNWIWGYVKRAYARSFQKKYELAEADAEKARELIGPWGSELLEAAIIFIYDNCENEPMKNQLIKRYFEKVNRDNYHDPFAVFYVHYINGDMELALDWAEITLKEKSPGLYQFNIDLFVKEDLLKQPRFIKIMEEMNFPKQETS